jgi:SAM-dependent methyltransferase
MDDATLTAYDKAAKAFADEWAAQPPPTDLQAVVRQFFVPGAPTADIGCGSGRDAAWLTANGFPTRGFDASEGLLAEARQRYPHIEFSNAVLPDPEAIAPAVERLLAIFVPGGILYLSWRVEPTDRRDQHGRLYAAFDPEHVLRGLAATQVLLDEEVGSVSSGRLIRRMVVRKN